MEIVIRASVIFLFLWMVTRVLGKRELAQMSAFELVLLIVMGDFVQQAVTQNDHSITTGIVAISTLAVWILTFSYAAYRSRRLATILEGTPTVVVNNGHVIPAALKVQRIKEEELFVEAREHGIDDLSKVRLAVLEADGRFSFITDGHANEDANDEHRI